MSIFSYVSFASAACVCAVACALASGSSPLTAGAVEPSSPARLAPAASVSTLAPVVAETRVYRIRQTVTLSDVPGSAKNVRMWVPIPGDAAWQHVLDRRLVEAPAGWKLEHQPGCDAEMIVVSVPGPAASSRSLSVVVETTVSRQSPKFDLRAPIEVPLQAAMFPSELRQDAPFMSSDPAVLDMAKKACADETDPARKVLRLLDAVADTADHYSKDPSKPKCGRGSAQDCLVNGGGCCTDLHSLFVAAARSQGIPARIQFGYRLNATKENTEYDPSYRCWVEFFLPGSGWVPTDIVVADAGAREARAVNFGTLDARRVWLWQGRSLELVPRQSGAPIETMSCGWAEIDGVPVDVLPAADGSPSKLARTIVFQDLTPKDSAPVK